jgi:DNA-binding response OmpR family regulator
MEKILIIEDDAAMLRGLKDNFETRGYKVVTAADGEAGLEAAMAHKPDLILLDIMLPKINGYEICRLVREAGLTSPIIMLTAKGEESDIILGLNLGADDYVTKPFSIKELMARAAAFLRRAKHEKGKIFEFGDFKLNIEARELTKLGKTIELTPKEYKLLEYFVSRPGRALTRDEILNQVWGYDCFVTQRSIDRCITTLRDKIEGRALKPRFIFTVREVGYKFEPD